MALEAPPKVASDVEVALLLAAAALSGALANVRINLPSIKDATFRRSVQQRLASIESK
jgi:formiminotetrahydrofolate cyclodeaminase